MPLDLVPHFQHSNHKLMERGPAPLLTIISCVQQRLATQCIILDIKQVLLDLSFVKAG